MEIALIFVGVIAIVICICIGIKYNKMLDGIADYIELGKEKKD